MTYPGNADGTFTSYEELPLFLTIRELQNVLGIGRNTAYNMVRSGQIRSVRFGNQIRVPKEALLKFI